ncbi:hypothetical protein JXQ70_00380 [bacterium]|nr:hypothetical protein [bacterium]
MQLVLKYTAIIQSLTLYALVFFLGNGSVELLLPGITISVGNHIWRYVGFFVLMAAFNLLMAPSRREQWHHYRKMLINPLTLLMVCITLASFISFSWYENLENIAEIWLGYLFCLALARWFEGGGYERKLLATFLLGELMMYFSGVKKFLSSSLIIINNYEHIITPLGDNMATAVAFSVCPPLVLVLVRGLSGWVRHLVLGCVAILICFSPLILTPVILGFSYLVGAIAMLVLLGMRESGSRSWAIMLIGFGLIGLGFEVFFATGGLGWLSVKADLIHLINTARHEFGLVAAVCNDFPLSGIGHSWGSFEFLLPRYLPIAEIEFHFPLSLYSHWLIAFGFLGLLGVGLIMCFAMRPIWWDKAGQIAGKNRTRLFFQSAFWAYLGAVLFYNPMANGRLMVMFWFLCGCILGCSRRDTV